VQDALERLFPRRAVDITRKAEATASAAAARDFDQVTVWELRVGRIEQRDWFKGMRIAYPEARDLCSIL
jgi:hypothetical protein